MKQQARFVEELDVFGCCPRERADEAHSAQLGKPMDAQTLQMMVCVELQPQICQGMSSNEFLLLWSCMLRIIALCCFE